ncbi:hypothetical protein BASA60_002492 [Batrachochytrium salamandrivorans]|nr:hypothetical protein BASA60_002492 [Batrachochytrium salamandrivorans]
MSLKRRNVFRGLSEEEIGTYVFPPIVPGSFLAINHPFNLTNADSINLASTIGKVVNNDYIFLLEGEIAAHKIGDPVKEVMAKYFKMCAYVDSAIEFWLHKSAPHILDLIKSGLGEDKYFEVGPELTETRKTVTDDLRAGYTKISSYIVKIVKDVSSVIDSLQKIDKLFKDAFYSSIDFIRRLRLQLLRFQIDETLEVALVNIIEAINDFIIMQTNLLEEIMKGLDAASSQ